jgi:DHA2 family multidrug resistance protein
MRAYAAIDGIARRESFIMAFSDCFFLMGATFVVGVVLVCLLQRVKPGAGATPGH